VKGERWVLSMFLGIVPLGFFLIRALVARKVGHGFLGGRACYYLEEELSQI
jgi:hypothetical protein